MATLTRIFSLFLLLFTSLSTTLLSRSNIGTLTAEEPSSTERSRPRSTGPYDFGFDVSRKLKRRQSQANVTTSSLWGGAPGTSEAYMRLEIRDLKNDPISWHLYVLALCLLQWVDQNGEDSYYSIASIHGLPFSPWNNVPPIPGSAETGYCHHTSGLFPSWHRVYTLTFEGIMYETVNEIASWFPNQTERALYQAAAVRFRIPYWDWAATPIVGQNVVLDEFVQETILAYGPMGFQTILNPFYSYKFRPLNSDAFRNLGFNVWEDTMRAPSDYTANAVSQDNQVVAAMNQLRMSLQQRIFKLFSTYSDYSLFSNKRWMQFPTNYTPDYDSIESVHDSVHMACGQNGHFEYVEYSGFDPMFFLHHAMIDRLVALWQVLYPDSWVQPLTALEPSYTTAAGQIEDAFSSLTPFRSDLLGNFWDSNMCRNVLNLGYGYQDMMPELSNDPAVQRQMVISRINQLYGNTVIPGALRGHRRSSLEKSSTKIDWDRLPDFSPDSLKKMPAGASVVKNNQYVEWVASVRVEVRALGRPFSVYIFFGSVPQDVRLWRQTPNLVGTFDVFAMISSPNSRTSQYQVSGSVPMTHALLRLLAAGLIPDVTPGGVEPYLRRNVKIRVATATDEVDPRLVEGLSICADYSYVKAAKSNTEFPQWGPRTKLFQIIGKD